MELLGATGRLSLMGGEDEEGDCTILKESVRVSKGAQARIPAITAATGHGHRH